MPARPKSTKAPKGDRTATTTDLASRKRVQCALDSSQTATFLVVGYGNVLRSDDGLGPKVAEAIAALRLPDVRAMACHQLTPELAEPISQARAVVFVDAAAGAEPAEVTVRPVQAVQAGRIAAHRSSPEALLALAEGLYGRAPRAWLVAVPAFALGFGEELSPQTLRHFQEAIRVIKRLRR